MSNLSFYFDESVEVAVSEQIALHKIDVVSAHSLGTLGDDDLVHLQRATEMGRVLCTYDTDFLHLAASFLDHTGIIFARSDKTGIGDWVREIRQYHATKTAEELRGQILFLQRR